MGPFQAPGPTGLSKHEGKLSSLPGSCSPHGVLGMAPLPVLVQAVDDGISLLDEGHEFLHQHCLSGPILVCPVLFCQRRKSG